jgi:copper(I)-binding protein
MKKLPLTLALVFSVCCAMHSMAGHHQKGTIEVDMPYVRAPVPGHSMTAAFLTLNNASEKDCRLTAASSSYAKKVEFHTHIHQDGMMKMRPVDTIDAIAGSSIAFKPGGLHLMLFGIKHGDIPSAEITISTDKCGDISFTAPIKSIKSKPAEAMHH